MSFLFYRSGSVGALAGNRQGHPARRALRRWLWPGRLRRPPRWESRKEVE